jgi:cell pole-organizing protein PopZ
MPEAKQTEPSMEEILASIRRIIAEDGDGPKPDASAQGDEVLELTEVVDDEGKRVAEAPPPPEPEPEPEPEPPPPPPPPPPTPAPPRVERPAPPPPPPEPEPEVVAERLVSEAAAAASVTALSSQLSALKRDRRGAEPPGLGFESGVTIEDLVREMLRPLLRDWLDANLPGLVERIVREEVSRIVSEAQER